MEKHNGKKVDIKHFYSFLFLSFFVAGPSLPKGLVGQEMVSIGYDLIVIGGYDGSSRSGSIYKFFCSNHICKWDKLPEELKTPRSFFTAILLPDNFIDCS